MSKDIRSYFTTQKTKKHIVEDDDDVIPESPDVQIKNKKKESRKKRVLADDSDEEIFSKKKKVSNESSASNKKSHHNKNKSPEKPALKEVKVVDLFGKGKIKRTEPMVKKVKKSTETGIHSDDEFEKSLLEVDAIEENALKEIKEKSPTRNDAKKNKPATEVNSDIKINGNNVLTEANTSKEPLGTTSSFVKPEKSPKTEKKSTKNDRVPSNTIDTEDIKQDTINLSNKERLPNDKEKTTNHASHFKHTKQNGDKISKKDSKKRDFSEFVDDSKSFIEDDSEQTPKSKKKKLDKSLNESVLTDEERHERKMHSAALYQKYLNRSGPKHLGAKEIPEGAPNCLAHCAFLLTGVLDSFERDEVVDAITRYGGCVKNGISKKVTHVLAGDDAGPAKMAKAQELGIKIISEDQFIRMIADSTKDKSENKKKERSPDRSKDRVKKEKDKSQERSSKKEKDKSQDRSFKKEKDKSQDRSFKKENDKSQDRSFKKDNDKSQDRSFKKENDKSQDRSFKKEKDKSQDRSSKKERDKSHESASKNHDRTKHNKSDTNTSKPNKSSDHVVKVEPKLEKEKDVKAEQSIATKTIERPSGSAKMNDKETTRSQSGPAIGIANAAMWVEKYKPQTIKQIIGQHGDASNVKKLMSWLTKWYTNRKAKLIKPSPWAKNDDGGFYKAVLLSGPPGVGKTTTVSLVCKELGFDTVEFNASDTRNKSLIKDQIGELLTTTSLAGYAKGSTGKQAVTKKHALVMDEVDGMAGNEDRGGLQELIALIKSTSVPIICMCNDRNSQKMRSLVNYCYDLRFNRPRVEQIKSAMMSICCKEGVKIPPDALTQLIVAAGQDVRQTLNLLSLWAVDPGIGDADSLKREAHSSRKDVKLGPWEAVRKVFSAEDHKTMSIMDKSDLFFYDYNLAPLFVQENYLAVSPHCPKKETLDRVSKAADSISAGDLVSARIRGRQAWNLLPVQAMYSSVIPGHWLSGHVSGQIQFPGWLGKNSRAGKMQRLCQEIHAHTRLSTSGSKSSIFLDYATHLRDAIVNPLLVDKADGVTKSVEVLEAYHLLRDDLNSLTELANWPGQRDPMILVEAKVKAAMTRIYNKKAAALPYAPGAVKRTRREAGDDGDDGEEEDDDGADDDSDPENDALIKKKKVEKPTTSKAKQAKEKPSTSKGKKK